MLRRILPISMFLLQKDGQCLSGHDLFLRRIGQTFQDFIEEVGLQEVIGVILQAQLLDSPSLVGRTAQEETSAVHDCAQECKKCNNFHDNHAVQVEAGCKHRCLEDLTSTTRFVSWSLHTKSTKSLKALMSKLSVPSTLVPQMSGASQQQSSQGGSRSSQQQQDATAGKLAGLQLTPAWTFTSTATPSESTSRAASFSDDPCLLGLLSYISTAAYVLSIQPASVSGRNSLCILCFWLYTTLASDVGVMIDLLEATLWQRQLGTLSEELVGALVAQVRLLTCTKYCGSVAVRIRTPAHACACWV